MRARLHRHVYHHIRASSSWQTRVMFLFSRKRPERQSKRVGYSCLKKTKSLVLVCILKRGGLLEVPRLSILGGVLYCWCSSRGISSFLSLLSPFLFSSLLFFSTRGLTPSRLLSPNWSCGTASFVPSFHLKFLFARRAHPSHPYRLE